MKTKHTQTQTDIEREMERQQDCRATQLIDSNGVFNKEGLNRFITTTGFASRGTSYRVVAIIGPQSSGKSTLLNFLFGTNFRELDARMGRRKTTKGIWIAKCVGIKQPFTIAMDVEGTDGKERGEDDTAFEKQSALFALAGADVVLINMWYHAIGLNQTANRPLLKTVFQVMMRLFGSRKRTLLFVIRDHTKTPLERLKSDLKMDIQEIWDEVPKPQAHKNTLLSNFFNVEVTALPHYEYAEAQFKQKVAQLRQQFFDSSLGGPASNWHTDTPASGFSANAQFIWNAIKENKDLDLPALKVMVATVRCNQICDEMFNRLIKDESWLETKKNVHAGVLVSKFGENISSILQNYLSKYDSETTQFDEGIRNAKRQLLVSRALNVVYPIYATLLDHICSQTLEKYKIELEKSPRREEDFAACKQSAIQEFNKKCTEAAVKHADWDDSNVPEKLLLSINLHAASAYNAKLSELENRHESALDDRQEDLGKSSNASASMDAAKSLYASAAATATALANCGAIASSNPYTAMGLGISLGVVCLVQTVAGVVIHARNSQKNKEK